MQLNYDDFEYEAAINVLQLVNNKQKDLVMRNEIDFVMRWS